MAAELTAMGIETQLIKGGRGIFDVKLDRALVFSKYTEGRFPRPGEVSTLAQERRGRG